MLHFNNEIINNRCFNREIDEHIAPKIIRFGSFLFDAKKSKMKDAALSIVAHLLVKLIFEGDDFLMKTEKEAEKLY